MLKKIFGHSILYSFANHLPLIANILILPLITPFLTKEDYGIYGLTFAYLGGLSAFSMLGIHVSLQNSFFKKKEIFKELWSKYYGILILWRVVYSFVVLVIFYFLFNEKIGDDIFLFLELVICPVLFFDLTKTIGTRYCQYTGNHQYVYISTFISSLFTIATSFFCIYFLRLGYLGFLFAAAVSGFIQFIFYFYLIHIKVKIVPVLKVKKKFLLDTLKVSLPIIPHYFAGYLLNTSDRLVLDLNNISLKKIGGYNLAYNFSNYFGSFNNSMNSILSPIYFKCFALKDQKKSIRLVNSLTILWFILILIFCLLICIWCKEIFNFLYRNPEFNDIYKYVPYLLVGMMYRPFYVACVDKNIFLEKTKEVLIISAGGGIINLILNLIFIPLYGIQIALYTTFISYIYMGFVGFYIPILKKNISFNYRPFYFILIIIFTLLLGISIRDTNVFTKTTLTFFIILGTLILYKFKLSTYINELNKENLI